MLITSTTQSYQHNNFIKSVINFDYLYEQEFLDKDFKLNFELDLIPIFNEEQSLISIDFQKKENIKKFFCDLYLDSDYVNTFNFDSEKTNVLVPLNKKEKIMILVFRDLSNKVLRRIRIKEFIVNQEINNFNSVSELNLIQIPYKNTIKFIGNEILKKFKFWNVYTNLLPINKEIQNNKISEITIFIEDEKKSTKYKIPSLLDFKIKNIDTSFSNLDNNKTDKISLIYNNNQLKDNELKYEVLFNNNKELNLLVSSADGRLKLKNDVVGNIKQEFKIETNYGNFKINKYFNIKKDFIKKENKSVIIEDITEDNLHLDSNELKYLAKLDILKNIEQYKINHWYKKRNEEDI
ncbi:hypothetical protein RRG37_03645 [Mycoplasmopsis felis]|uniref:hypothetical protein n=1 Tax=Mycoplasmopsis felis TaxID=33923 RepID=UPI002AFDDF49|nr:hypothetical protein [Mycoplasmopsis felis]WQQ06427.1 hypothetical protein RRG40_01155 [Mycoplasmopsis felis]